MDFLTSWHVSNIASVKIYSYYYINKSNNLAQEKIEDIIFPEVLSHLQQEFKYLRENLFHLHVKSMFRLETLETSRHNFYI